MSDRWERILAKYGLATALALGLVYWMASSVSGDIGEIKRTLGSHISETNFYLRAICINVAQNDAQRAGCIPPRDR